MRVLVTSTPGTGHLHPLVPLVREIVALGHEVVWATAESACAKVQSLGFRTVPSGLDPDVRRSMVLDRIAHVVDLPPRERRAVQLSVTFGDVVAPAMRDDLSGVFADFKPDLVVHEFAELAAAPMSNARGIPCVCVGFSNAISDSVQTAVEASVAPVWKHEGLQVSTATFNGDLLLHPFPALLDTPRPDVPSAPMRPLAFDGAPLTPPPEWADSFGKDRPGAYVTFGTEVSQRAPWNALLEALSDLDVDVVATVGSQLDPTTLGPLAPNIRVEQYVPQSFVIDRADVVVSHGGAGTVIGAATAGVVQLCVPIAADQWDNADLLAAANVGMVLEAEERDADTIRHSIERLLDDESMRTDAQVLSDHFASMPHPSQIATAIDQFV
jgi:UDP:flavonoid glycosyltransferase YjiC (YdhE family)